MALVPESSLQQQQLQQQQYALQPNVLQMSSLDQEMQAILTNQNIDADTKMTAYDQLLRRYRLAREKELARPMLVQSVDQPIESEPQLKAPTLPVNAILNSMPKVLQNKTSLLLEHIRQHPNKFQLSEQNELIVDGKKIDGSHITDLVHQVVRNRKGQDLPGIKEFAKALEDSNVPQEAVGSRIKLQDLQQEKPPSAPALTSPVTVGVPKDYFVTPQSQRLLEKMQNTRKRIRELAAERENVLGSTSTSAGDIWNFGTPLAPDAPKKRLVASGDDDDVWGLPE